MPRTHTIAFFPDHASAGLAPSLRMNPPVLLALSCLLAFNPDHASAGLAPSLKMNPPALPKKPELDPEDVVRFTKNLYKDLGRSWNNTSDVADKYRPEFHQLDVSTNGTLKQTLSSLLAIRMLDLQASVRHARKMRTVVESLGEKQAEDEAI